MVLATSHKRASGQDSQPSKTVSEASMEGKESSIEEKPADAGVVDEEEEEEDGVNDSSTEEDIGLILTNPYQPNLTHQIY